MIHYLAEGWKDADLAGWNGPGWYFWDETQANCIGPFNTRIECKWVVERYQWELDGKQEVSSSEA